ncbi:MAG TPA: (d)CMP kinase [bacterium]|nr:(d)CMP kinase [bacterium]
MSSKELVITIDGPAGSGKSTVAALLAATLGYAHVSTGDIYRAVAWLTLQTGVEPQEEEGVLELIRRATLEFRLVQGKAQIFISGENISTRLRSEEVGRTASILSAHPRVREALLPAQRQTAEWGSVVVDGRDAGTVIFPDAEVRFFLDASPQERARRRYLELKDRTEGLDLSQVLEDLHRRDLRDSRRSAAPLQVPQNAVVVDSSGLTPEEVVARMVEVVCAHRLARRCG